MKQALIVMAGFCIAQVSHSATTDYVECMRNKTDFKQFCYIKEDKIDFSIVLNSSVSNQDVEYDIGEVITDRKIILEEDDTDGSEVRLHGLAPRVRATANWVTSIDCLTSDLWSDRISFGVYNPNTVDFKTIAPVSYGLDYYDFDLGLYDTEGFDPISYTINGDIISIDSSLGFKNLDHLPTRPLANQRIPLECGLLVSDVTIGFDAPSLALNVEYMEILAKDKISLMTKALVLHGNYVDTQNGAFCAPYRLGNTLLEVEGGVDWFDLFDTSIFALEDAIEKAINLNAIDGSNIDPQDYFDYFISSTYQDAALLRCNDTTTTDYDVSTAPFMAEDGVTVNHLQGYNNALDYDRSTRNLIKLITGTHAIIEVSKYDLETIIEADWINDPVIHSYIY